MAYRLKQTETVAEGVRRIAREQAERGLVAATREDLSPAERVHAARTRCKKLRGLLRLVREPLGDIYEGENPLLRDAARGLSAVRDRTVVLKALDSLASGDGLDHEKAGSLRSAIEERLQTSQSDDAGGLASFAEAMRDLIRRVDEWEPGEVEFRAVRGGLVEQYRRGRRAMRTAVESDEPADWHEWRKAAKYHWYHVRLLRGVWRPVMEARSRALSRLADLLGDAHDLDVLQGLLAEVTPGDEGTQPLVFELIERRREELRTEARPLGERLYAERPRAFARRMRAYWRAWRAG
jgi:CHAD domain-containing protein